MDHRAADGSTVNEIDTKLIKGGKQMGYVYFIILIVAIVIAFFAPMVSIIIYGLIVVLFIAITAFGRAEYAITLQVPKNPVKE